MFTSTRGECRPHSLEEVMFTSFAPDGGMFLPEVIPTLTSAEMDSFSKASFQDITIDVLGKFVSLPSQDLSAIVTNAFAELPFEPGFTVLGDGIQICDLQNGPSLAFKDYGVAVVAGFLDYFVRQRNSGKVLNIVVATSGDTGPSAMCAVRKYPETLRLYVLYPENAISPAQKHQMISEASSAPNVHVIGGLEADSDSLDTVLTSVFSNPGDMELGSINSINVIRVLVQACFYVYIASRHLGREISVTVPSGALGNLASGLLAYRMGVPISQFIAACNVNNALSRLFTEGKLLKWKGPAKNTLSNAMDIAVPYNLWRFLYLTAADGDASLVKTWQDQYESGCEVQISPKLLSQIPVSTTTINDKETVNTMKQVRLASKVLIDPHTAVGVCAARRIELPRSSVSVVISTAHIAKFLEVSMNALDESREVLLMESNTPDAFKVMLDSPVSSNVIRVKTTEQCQSELEGLLKRHNK